MTKRKMKELDDGTLVDVGWTDMDNQCQRGYFFRGDER